MCIHRNLFNTDDEFVEALENAAVEAQEKAEKIEAAFKTGANAPWGYPYEQSDVDHQKFWAAYARALATQMKKAGQLTESKMDDVFNQLNTIADSRFVQVESEAARQQLLQLA